MKRKKRAVAASRKARPPARAGAAIRARLALTSAREKITENQEFHFCWESNP